MTLTSYDFYSSSSQKRYQNLRKLGIQCSIFNSRPKCQTRQIVYKQINTNPRKGVSSAQASSSAAKPYHTHTLTHSLTHSYYAISHQTPQLQTHQTSSLPPLLSPSLSLPSGLFTAPKSHPPRNPKQGPQPYTA